MKSKQNSLLLIALLANISLNLCYSQDSYRRHFIIAYDISSDFRTLERENVRFQRAIEDLFQNLRVDIPSGNTNVLISERQKGKLFFDQEKDEISFFHFNIPFNELQSLSTMNISDWDEVIRTFSDSFVRITPITWSAYRDDRRGPNIIDFMGNIFRLEFNPAEVSAPNLVYPLIMNIIDSRIPAEEYILIILTQGVPHSYNDQDIAYLNKLYAASLTINEDTPATIINNQIDDLNKSFLRVDYFNYTLNTGRFGISPIGIYGYSILPQGIDPGSSVSPVSIDSEIKLSQTRFQSPIFKLLPVKFTFPQNSTLRPVKTVLKITRKNDSSENIVFEDTISYLNCTGRWISNYIRIDKLRKLINGKSSFKTPGLKIFLEDPISDISNLNIHFEFIAQINPANSNPVNYTYNTDASINEVKIVEIDIRPILYRVFFISLAVLILLIIFYGIPRGMDFKFVGFLDSITVINYRPFSRRHRPYAIWDLLSDNKLSITVEGEVRYSSRNYIFNWKHMVEIRIIESTLELPGDFNVFLFTDSDPYKRYFPGNRMHVNVKKNDFKFFIEISLNNINIELKEPKFFRIEVETLLKIPIFFTGLKIKKRKNYEFYVGEDLGDNWVGLDPGTTGSCICIGNPSSGRFELGGYIQEKGAPITIIPSKIIFDTSKDFALNDDILPTPDTYIYGVKAAFDWSSASSPPFEKFQSVKKMLGYNNEKAIIFANGEQYVVNGKRLSGIIIKGMYDYLMTFLENTDSNALNFGERINNVYTCHARRAVIAVPNNSTNIKIKDIIESVGYLGHFKDIRYIYEAEAVLFYYLKNWHNLNKNRKTIENETILIFDMGGATINATVITVSKKEQDKSIFYNIDILSKIGYSIGGDSIDYCITECILKFSHDIPQLRAINENKSRYRNELFQLARDIKEENIYENFEKNNFLITDIRLRDYINRIFNLKLDENIIRNSQLHQIFQEDNNGKFPLLSDPLFTKIIYNNVRDAISEVVLDLSKEIDTIIFSGRSTHFPLIRETVEEQVPKKHESAQIIELDLEASKTAVAEGACWYGIINNNISLDNRKTYASFGVCRTRDANQNYEFIELIKSGRSFKSDKDADGLVGEKQLRSDFNFDGRNVNFFQVMGRDSNEIFNLQQKHKFSRINSIHIQSLTERIGMIVKENDYVKCQVKTINDDNMVEEKGVVPNQEITEANEEHYTWVFDL